MKSFRDRNPVAVGAVCTGAILLAMLVAFQLETITGWFGTKYRAAFTDASGLAPRDEVRIAGIKVGTVLSVRLAGIHPRAPRQDPYVEVVFRVDGDVTLGERTRALIAIKTIFGQKFLALEPAGPGAMSADELIPRSRTTSPFDVVDAFSGLADAVSTVDVAQLARALSTLAATLDRTAPHVKSSLAGLSRLSRAVADRDRQLRELLRRTRGVTKVLADRREEFRKLVSDGNALLDEVSRRRDAIHNLLVATDELARQLSGVAADNREQLKPALVQLRGVVKILQDNKASLEGLLKRLGPHFKAFSNVVGNGRWVDNYIDGLIQPYSPGAPAIRVQGGDRPGSLWATR